MMILRCLTGEKAQLLHLNTSPAESLLVSYTFLKIYGILLSWLGELVLLWQPISEMGFWCQAGTVLMPVVDGGPK